MKVILDKQNQEFFLTCGTLLGCVRDKNFIPYDNDIDIGIFNNKFKPSIEQHIIHSKKFTLKHKLGKIEDSYELSFKHKNGVSIDIFLHYPLEENNYYYCPSFFGICDKKLGGFCRWKYHINGLKNIKFQNELYLIPSNEEEYLEKAYGKNWKIPIQFTYREGLQGKYKNLMD
jgi:phosphorylcholine metabolism protein LicD